jgi:hypothetical protein
MHELIFVQFSQINVPYGRPTEFSIVSADGAEYNLKPGENAPWVSYYTWFKKKFHTTLALSVTWHNIAVFTFWCINLLLRAC